MDKLPSELRDIALNYAGYQMINGKLIGRVIHPESVKIWANKHIAKYRFSNKHSSYFQYIDSSMPIKTKQAWYVLGEIIWA